MPEENTYTGVERPSLSSRLKHAWNAFRNKPPIYQELSPSSKTESAYSQYYPGYISSRRPDRKRFGHGVDKTLIASIYTRIAVDASQAVIHHVKTDDNGMYLKEMKSGLNNVLTCEANIDQTGRAFVMDMVLSMLDEGCIAAVPVDTTIDPNSGNTFEIDTMRVGKIMHWEPERVGVELYNDNRGVHEMVWISKRACAIVENPFYHIMNEPSSTMQRLSRKMALMDVIDDEIGSKKLDLIIQLPYVVKNKTKQEQADERRKQLEHQLESSKLGIGYIDGTERVIQLNRSLENNLMAQVDSLTSMLYGQLGMTAEIMNGTASEAVMMNYYKRTIDPILTAICDEFERTFLSKTARSQHQAIQFYREPFSLTPATVIADIADKFTRNEILSPNELRGIVGFMPSSDEAANELRNRNINQQSNGDPNAFASVGEGGDDGGEVQDAGFLPEETSAGIEMVPLASFFPTELL